MFTKLPAQGGPYPSKGFRACSAGSIRSANANVGWIVACEYDILHPQAKIFDKLHMGSDKMNDGPPDGWDDEIIDHLEITADALPVAFLSWTVRGNQLT
ncbi:MAG: hypothetical protein HFF15_11920 [Angelakisella sp.]|nr:hypothetical protein [Angelakisella sp.]